MVSKPQAFPCRLSTLPGMRTLPFAKLRWPLDASHLLQSLSPRSRSSSRSKRRQGVPRLRSLVDGLIKVCTCMSAIGTLETCRRHPRMSVNRETGSDRPTAKPSLLTQNSPNQRCRSCIARRGRCKRWVAVPSVASKEANATTVACLRCRDHEID